MSSDQIINQPGNVLQVALDVFLYLLTMCEPPALAAYLQSWMNY